MLGWSASAQQRDESLCLGPTSKSGNRRINNRPKENQWIRSKRSWIS